MFNFLLFFWSCAQVHQVADGSDAHAQAGQLAHPSAGQAEAQGDSGQAQGEIFKHC